jgi:myosin heavy subunit
MNLMGKIFTLLILLMSVAFLVVAVMVGASDRNWKAAAQRMKEDAQTATRNISDSKSEIQDLEKILAKEQVFRTQHIANLESQLRRSRANLAQKEKQLTEELKISQANLREMKEANNRLTELDKELSAIKANNKNLVDDIANQFEDNRIMEKKLFEQTSKLERLKQQEADMAAKIAVMSKVMIKNGLNEQSLTDDIPPKVEAVVTAVGKTGELFSIMVGMDDGLRRGHELEIYRSNRFVGTGKVIKADNNNSVLRIVDGMMNDVVREGDSVSTKLF